MQPWEKGSVLSLTHQETAPLSTTPSLLPPLYCWSTTAAYHNILPSGSDPPTLGPDCSDNLAPMFFMEIGETTQPAVEPNNQIRSSGGVNQQSFTVLNRATLFYTRWGSGPWWLNKISHNLTTVIWINEKMGFYQKKPPFFPLPSEFFHKSRKDDGNWSNCYITMVK